MARSGQRSSENWLVGLIIFLEFVVFVLWRVLKKLERALWEKR
jgi:hypothetical protein